MADQPTYSYYSQRGTILYTPNSSIAQTARFPSPPCRPRQRRQHLIRVTQLPADYIPVDLLPTPPSPEPKKLSRIRIDLRKLASRENAKRVLGTVFLPFITNTSSAASSSAASPPRVLSPSSHIPSDESSAMATHPSIDRGPGLQHSNAHPALLMPEKSTIETEKPICSGNGVACYIELAEPVIFLSGLDHDGTTRDSHTNSTAILRGKMRLNVTKAAKIKAVTLRFTGRARTEWPEGIPPEKIQNHEETSLKTQIIPFFNALYDGAESGYGNQCTYLFRDKGSASSSVTNLGTGTETLTPLVHGGFYLPALANRSNRSSTITTSKDMKRLSLQNNQSRSFNKSESQHGPTPQQKGYKIFHPGVYEYSFELPIDHNSPETVKLPMAAVLWQLEALVERSGTFRSDLQGFREVPVVRVPSEDSMELVEPISISRKWEDQLQYEIMISGKSFPLGSKIPIAFKLTPLAKVQVHKIKVFVSESVEYFTNNKRVTRKDTPRRMLLLEKSAGRPLDKQFIGSEVHVLAGGELSAEDRIQARIDAARRRAVEAAQVGREAEPLPPPTENILGDIELGLEQFWGQTEIEMNVQLPTCEMMEKEKMRKFVPDTTWKCANVHHWIKILMRISRVDADDPTGKKRRHFEISIDSPFTILSCRATRANLALPEYGVNPVTDSLRICGCPNAAMSGGSPHSSSGDVPTLDNMPANVETPIPGLARPPQAHLAMGANVQRPIHMLRAPSYNPPAFDAEEPPPPAVTPPPLYDHVIGTPSHDGLADYFSRLSQYDDDHTDDEDFSRASDRGRVNVPHPRTPGGRLARSMDIDRQFMFNPEVLQNPIGSESSRGPI